MTFRGATPLGNRGSPGGIAKPGGSGGSPLGTGRKPGGIGGKPGGGGGRPVGRGMDSPLLLMNPGRGGCRNFLSLWFSRRTIGGAIKLIFGITELNGAIWIGCGAAVCSPSVFASG